MTSIKRWFTSKWKKEEEQPQVGRVSQKAIAFDARQQVRVLICQESDLKGKIVLFDSSRLGLLSPTDGATQPAPARKSDAGATAKSNAKRAPDAARRANAAKSIEQLGDMMFGATPIIIHSAVSKLHNVLEPSQMLFSRVVGLSVTTPETRVTIGDEETVVMPPRQLRSTFAIGVVFTMPTPEPLQTFLFSHYALIELHIERIMEVIQPLLQEMLAAPVAGNQPRSGRLLPQLSLQSLQPVRETVSRFISGIEALLSAPRIADPIWLTMARSPSHRARLLTTVFDELNALLTQWNSSKTGFFLATALTAALTTHSGWVTTVADEELHAHVSHPNAIAGQLCALYGAASDRYGRTIVVGRNRAVVERLLYVLTYFIRCPDIEETLEDMAPWAMADEESDDTSLVIIDSDDEIPSTPRTIVGGLPSPDARLDVGMITPVTSPLVVRLPGDPPPHLDRGAPLRASMRGGPEEVQVVTPPPPLCRSRTPSVSPPEEENRLGPVRRLLITPPAPNAGNQGPTAPGQGGADGLLKFLEGIEERRGTDPVGAKKAAKRPRPDETNPQASVLLAGERQSGVGRDKVAPLSPVVASRWRPRGAEASAPTAGAPPMTVPVAPTQAHFPLNESTRSFSDILGEVTTARYEVVPMPTSIVHHVWPMGDTETLSEADQQRFQFTSAGRSLLAGYCDTYSPDFALMGLPDVATFQDRLFSDLAGCTLSLHDGLHNARDALLTPTCIVLNVNDLVVEHYVSESALRRRERHVRLDEPIPLRREAGESTTTTSTAAAPADDLAVASAMEAAPQDQLQVDRVVPSEFVKTSLKVFGGLAALGMNADTCLSYLEDRLKELRRLGVLAAKLGGTRPPEGWARDELAAVLQVHDSDMDLVLTVAAAVDCPVVLKVPPLAAELERKRKLHQDELNAKRAAIIAEELRFIME